MGLFLFIFLLFLYVTACAYFGSFANVAIDRIARGESLLGLSHCDHCGKTIAFYFNIPVLGWLLLGGRSACCRLPLSPQYPSVEAAFALVGVFCLFFPPLLGAVMFWVGGFSIGLTVYHLKSSLSRGQREGA